MLQLQLNNCFAQQLLLQFLKGYTCMFVYTFKWDLLITFSFLRKIPKSSSYHFLFILLVLTTVTEVLFPFTILRGNNCYYSFGWLMVISNLSYVILFINNTFMRKFIFNYPEIIEAVLAQINWKSKLLEVFYFSSYPIALWLKNSSRRWETQIQFSFLTWRIESTS